MGQSMSKARGFLEVDGNITVAVLPHLKYSAAVSAAAHRRGLDVILHAPMEPVNMKLHNPGDGALLTTMSAAEIKEKLDGDLGTVPHAIGVNNHMGSKFTGDKESMAVVLRLVRSKNLFFLDSRTTGGSVAAELARKMGVPSAGRRTSFWITNGTRPT